jgi:hypothetical protein
MVALCREKAELEGFSPTLFAQPMHALDAPRRYRTIYVCGAFGLGSTRAQDREALRRFRAHLEPGGTLLVDTEVPYADKRLWKYWPADARAALPEAAEPPRDRKRASDGSEYALRARLVELDPLEQEAALEMHAELWRDGKLEAEEKHALTIRLYFRNELELMLEQAGFADVEVQGDHNDAPATAGDDFIVLIART